MFHKEVKDMKKRIILIILVVIMLMSASCQTKEYQIIAGKILSAGAESMLIQVTEGSEEDMLQVHITDKTKFEKGIPSTLEKGGQVRLSIDDEILDSYPAQVYAIKILEYESPST